MSKDIFSKLEDYLEVINNKYIQAITYFYIHDSLKNTRAENLLWKDKAQKNVDIMNRYNYILWQPLEIWMMNLAIIELYKIFEKDDECITIHKVICYIQTNRKYINKEIKNDFQKRWIEWHWEITNQFLLDLIEDIDKVSDKITKLKLSRDNRSHSLKKKKQELLIYKDIEDIHNIFDKLYNSLTIKLKSGETDYSYMIKNIWDDFNFLLDSLKTFDWTNFELLKYFQKEKYSKVTSDDKNTLIDKLREYY